MRYEEIEFLRVGNVIQLPEGSVVIVSKNDDVNKKICWIDLDHSNSQGTIPYNSLPERVECECTYNPHNLPIRDCEDCDGYGWYIEKYPSMEDGKLLAENVKDYLKDWMGLTKLFG